MKKHLIKFVFTVTFYLILTHFIDGPMEAGDLFVAVFLGLGLWLGEYSYNEFSKDDIRQTKAK